MVKKGLVFTITELTLAETNDSPTYQNPKKKVEEVIPNSAIIPSVLASFGNDDDDDLLEVSELAFFLWLEHIAYSENGIMMRQPSAARSMENAMGAEYLRPNLTAVKLDPKITTTEISSIQ